MRSYKMGIPGRQIIHAKPRKLLNNASKCKILVAFQYTKSVRTNMPTWQQADKGLGGIREAITITKLLN